MAAMIPCGMVMEPRPGKRTGRLGIGLEKLDRSLYDPMPALSMLAQSGAHYVRLQSGWQRTERKKGKYDFTWLDTLVDALFERGMEPWIDLCYGNALYTPKAGAYFGAVGCAPTETAEERNAWAAYVRAVVSRYRGKVRFYEIWNEPDGIWCWKSGVDAASYARFACDTADAIHRADEEALAVAGVLCSVNLPFFRALLDAGLAEHADALSYHRYNANEITAWQEHQSLRALADAYRPGLMLIQGESGTQSRPGGAGALNGGAWSEEKQMKYLLRHRLIDLATDSVLISHFSALDMPEALNGDTSDRRSWLDYGYFGILSATFGPDGLADGTYRPKPSYRAFQVLCALFSGDVRPVALPVVRKALPSPSVFGQDADDARILSFGYADENGQALAYWMAVDLMRETYEGTVSFSLAGERRPIRLIRLSDGAVFAIPEENQKREGGLVTGLVNLPLSDTPYLLTFGNFAKGALREGTV